MSFLLVTCRPSAHMFHQFTQICRWRSCLFAVCSSCPINSQSTLVHLLPCHDHSQYSNAALSSVPWPALCHNVSALQVSMIVHYKSKRAASELLSLPPSLPHPPSGNEFWDIEDGCQSLDELGMVMVCACVCVCVYVCVCVCL